jgi:2,4-dienoyl-CoA reductase-like NADH-dependent reductase (Old Yellow Enzyme family)
MLREMTRDEIEFVIQKHVEAALRARKAGYDGVMINVAHGTLLHMFLSPKRNKRSDEYGGSLENRCRFACESIRRVRKAVGSDFCIIVRMCGEDFLDGGVTLEDALKQAPLFVEAGAEALDISAGVFHVNPQGVPDTSAGGGFRAPMTEAIKKAVNVPVVLSVGSAPRFYGENPP